MAESRVGAGMGGRNSQQRAVGDAGADGSDDEACGMQMQEDKRVVSLVWCSRRRRVNQTTGPRRRSVV